MGVAQDSPTRDWLDGWVDFLQGTAKAVFVVVVMILIIVILVRRTRTTHAQLRVVGDGYQEHESHWIRRVVGGPRGAILFGIGAGLLLWLLTNTDNVAEFFRDELPIGGQ